MDPTKNSGSGWIEKEDGQSEHILCQLKSTDAESIRIRSFDLQTLEHNAAVSHKIPIFAVQFLGSGDIWLMARPGDLKGVAQYFEYGERDKLPLRSFDLSASPAQASAPVSHKIVSSKKAREKFYEEVFVKREGKRVRR